MTGDEIRLRLEAREDSLSPFAQRSRLTKGRLHPEPPPPTRTQFQRDRDRILYSNSFRRLKHKTQVFIAPLGDHYVTRLTHTLEVSQIARSIARALNLNEDLAEAIALGHDLGHTPFGHIGEEVLNELLPGGFHHNEQSLRVVDLLEKDGRGLNLTWEVRDGILRHSKGRYDVLGSAEDRPATLEGQTCRLADSIAYINHDISDALRADVIRPSDLPASAVALLGETPSRRIDTMVRDSIEASWERPAIALSPPTLKAAEELQAFLFQRVYDASAATPDARQAREVVRKLYSHFLDHPQAIPAEFPAFSGERLERRAIDYVSGMTDGFALRLAGELGLPKAR
ncbi:MAG: deoxyguanosinetriphosphate triphosphohydrolase [Chloroflexi bacterium]|nr:deoxyguanosinetriphosphate triphosphohydrolase [Chloroflexota bacterium]